MTKRRTPARVLSPKFHRALERPRDDTEPTAVNENELRAAFAALAECSDRLMGYEEYLQAARERKAALGRSELLEADVLLQARRAEAAARELTSSAARSASQLVGGGMFNASLKACRDPVAAKRRVRARDLWSDALATPGLREQLTAHGLTEVLIDRCSKVIAGLDHEFVVKNDDIVVSSPATGQRAVLRSRPYSGRPTSVRDLLLRPRLDAAAAWLAAGHDAPIASAPVSPGVETLVVVDPLEATIAGCAAVRQDIARHVRKLEDTRLATYAASDPVLSGLAIAVIIVALVLITGGGILAAFCKKTANPYATCWVAHALELFGFVLIALAAGTLLTTYLIYGSVLLPPTASIARPWG